LAAFRACRRRVDTCLTRTRYAAKDARKAAQATKYIGRGSYRSSTNAYRLAIGPDFANTGDYDAQDVVWISAEGNRAGRVNPDFTEIGKAIAAGQLSSPTVFSIASGLTTLGSGKLQRFSPAGATLSSNQASGHPDLDDFVGKGAKAPLFPFCAHQVRIAYDIGDERYRSSTIGSV
jgi:hypothetical protein